MSPVMPRDTYTIPADRLIALIREQAGDRQDMPVVLVNSGGGVYCINSIEQEGDPDWQPPAEGQFSRSSPQTVVIEIRSS